MEQHIVKRAGQTEPFDEKKVYGSVFWACKSAHCNEILAERHANTVLQRVREWIENKQEVDSQQIFEFVTRVLEDVHPEAAYLYKTLRDVN